jgi:hypothetical protein
VGSSDEQQSKQKERENYEKRTKNPNEKIKLFSTKRNFIFQLFKPNSSKDL